MKTIVVKVDLDRATTLAQDYEDLTWEETENLLRHLAEESRFFHVRMAKPRAIRLGKVRVILAGFYDTKEGIPEQRDDAPEVVDE